MRTNFKFVLLLRNTINIYYNFKYFCSNLFINTNKNNKNYLRNNEMEMSNERPGPKVYDKRSTNCFNSTLAPNVGDAFTFFENDATYEFFGFSFNLNTIFQHYFNTTSFTHNFNLSYMCSFHYFVAN